MIGCSSLKLEGTAKIGEPQIVEGAFYNFRIVTKGRWGSEGRVFSR